MNSSQRSTPRPPAQPWWPAAFARRGQASAMAIGLAAVGLAAVLISPAAMAAASATMPPAAAPEPPAAAATNDAAAETASFEQKVKVLVDEEQHLRTARRELDGLRAQMKERDELRRREEMEQQDGATTQPERKAHQTLKAIKFTFDLRDTQALLDLALSLYKLDRYEEALQYYDQIDVATLGDDDRAWVLLQRGNCHFFMGEYDTCRELMTQIVSTTTDSEWARQAAATIKDLHFWKKRNTIIAVAKPQASAEAQVAAKPQPAK